MIDLERLRVYITRPALTVGEFTFTVTIEQDEDTFSIVAKTRQQDTKEEHLVQFRIGIGQHEKSEAVHETHKPHFELDYYKREDRSFSATLYFTFDEPTDEKLQQYAEGTLVVITRILQRFFKTRRIEEDLTRLIAAELVLEELADAEPALLDALHACYRNSELIVRQKGAEPIVIKTPYKLRKYLGHGDLLPLYEPLAARIEEETSDR